MTGGNGELTAWLLHSRPFRDSSLLVDFLTLERGRVSAVARGVRSSKSRLRSLLQPFTPLCIETTGRHELQTLKRCEARGPLTLPLQGEHLLAGFYVNELLVRLLGSGEAEASLFACYERTLHGLASRQDLESVLRNFELELLDCLGYGVQFDADSVHGDCLEASAWYYVQPEGGFVRHAEASRTDQSGRNGLYRGADLLCIMRRDFSSPEVRQSARLLLRELLQSLLGERPLGSRDLFRQYRNSQS